MQIMCHGSRTFWMTQRFHMSQLFSMYKHGFSTLTRQWLSLLHLHRLKGNVLKTAILDIDGGEYEGQIDA